MAAGAAASAVSPDAQAAELWAALAGPLNALRRIGASAQSPILKESRRFTYPHLLVAANLTCCMNTA